MYLVVLSHTMDDIPLRLFADEEKAKAYAAEVDGNSPDADYWKTDASTPCSVSIVEFDGEGKAVKHTLIKGLL